MRLDRQQAWLEGVERVPSPNHDPRPAGCEIDLLIIHGISLPPGEFLTPHVAALFCNRLDPGVHPYFGEIAHLRVSAHALIRRDGSVIQFVAFSERAWHAGASHFAGRSGCNDFSIGIELEGTDEIPYEDAQYERLAELTRVLMAAWPGITTDRIVGHCHVAPGRKTDPGAAFDWHRYRAMLARTGPCGGTGGGGACVS